MRAGPVHRHTFIAIDPALLHSRLRLLNMQDFKSDLKFKIKFVLQTKLQAGYRLS